MLPVFKSWSVPLKQNHSSESSSQMIFPQTGQRLAPEISISFVSPSVQPPQYSQALSQISQTPPQRSEAVISIQRFVRGQRNTDLISVRDTEDFLVIRGDKADAALCVMQVLIQPLPHIAIAVQDCTRLCWGSGASYRRNARYLPGIQIHSGHCETHFPASGSSIGRGYCGHGGNCRPPAVY